MWFHKIRTPKRAAEIASPNPSCAMPLPRRTLQRHRRLRNHTRAAVILQDLLAVENVCSAAIETSDVQLQEVASSLLAALLSSEKRSTLASRQALAQCKEMILRSAHVHQLYRLLEGTSRTTQTKARSLVRIHPVLAPV
jgi:hypothetical protein